MIALAVAAIVQSIVAAVWFLEARRQRKLAERWEKVAGIWRSTSDAWASTCARYERLAQANHDRSSQGPLP